MNDVYALVIELQAQRTAASCVKLMQSIAEDYGTPHRYLLPVMAATTLLLVERMNRALAANIPGQTPAEREAGEERLANFHDALRDAMASKLTDEQVAQALRDTPHSRS